MISIINNERLLRNMTPMGFLNPFLYLAHAHHPEAFNDVTSGNNVSNLSYCVEYVNNIISYLNMNPMHKYNSFIISFLNKNVYNNILTIFE